MLKLLQSRALLLGSAAAIPKILNNLLTIHISTVQILHKTTQKYALNP